MKINKFNKMRPLIFVFCALTLFLPSVSIAEDEIYDPLETINRGVFWFNDQADIYVIGPITQGYRYILPAPARTSIKAFFDNLRFPMFVVSDVMQLKFDQVGDHTARFALNSTFGLLGLFDVAKDLGYPEHYEDIGVALGYDGIGPGPYLVIPLLGPSNARDLFGRVADISLYPTAYSGYFSNASDDLQYAIGYGGNAFAYIQYRAALDQAVRSAKDASLDYYLFVRGAYYQVRQGFIYDGKAPSSDGEENFEDEDEEAFE